jgi:hypothetical protein
VLHDDPIPFSERTWKCRVSAVKIINEYQIAENINHTHYSFLIEKRRLDRGRGWRGERLMTRSL